MTENSRDDWGALRVSPEWVRGLLAEAEHSGAWQTGIRAETWGLTAPMGD